MTKTDNQSEIAQQSGIDQTAISTWKRTGPPTRSVTNLARFARAYRRPLPEVLQQAGMLTAEEAAWSPEPLRLIPTDALLAELARRIADCKT